MMGESAPPGIETELSSTVARVVAAPLGPEGDGNVATRGLDGAIMVVGGWVVQEV
jgi:hypothetical protein